MTRSYDVLVLGGGNGGMAAAGVTRAAGRSVAIVESWELGGTCPLRGCVPKKVLVAAAQVMHQIDRAPRHHISVDAWSLDWGRLIARVRGFVAGVPEAFEESLEARGIELLKGRARFVGPKRSRWTAKQSRPARSSLPPARSPGHCRSRAPSI